MVDEAADAADELAHVRQELAAAHIELQRLTEDAAAATTGRDEAEREAEVLRAEVERGSELAASLEAQIASSNERLRFAAVRYRDLAIRAEPAVPPELVSGDTVEAVDASLASARAMAERMREHLASQSESARVPAGAPERRAPDVGALSPEQKIRYGLQQQRNA